jgi:WD40 repeat protein
MRWIFLILIILSVKIKAQETRLMFPQTKDASISSFEFSPDGKYLLSIGEFVILYDVLSGRELNRKTVGDPYQGYFSSDGKQIILLTEITGLLLVIALDFDSFEEIKRYNIEIPLSLYRSKVIRNRNLIVFVDEESNTIKTFDIYKWELIFNIKPGVEISSIDFSKDGMSIIVSSFKEGKVFIYNLLGELTSQYNTLDKTTQNYIKAEKDKYQPLEIFSQEGCTVSASLGEKLLILTDYSNEDVSIVLLKVIGLQNDEEYTLMSKMSTQFISVGASMSDDSKFAVVYIDSTLSVYSLDSMKLVYTETNYGRSYYELKFTSNGMYLETEYNNLSKGDNNYTIYETSGYKKIFESNSYNHQFDSKNNLLLIENDSLSIYSTLDFKELTSSKEVMLKFETGPQSPVGNYYSTIYEDGSVKVFETGTKEIHSFKHNSKVNFTSFSQDGKYLLTASDDSIVRVYDLTTGNEFRNYKMKSVVNGANFTYYGNFLLIKIGSMDDQFHTNIYIYDFKNNKLKHKLSKNVYRYILNDESYIVEIEGGSVKLTSIRDSVEYYSKNFDQFFKFEEYSLSKKEFLCLDNGEIILYNYENDLVKFRNTPKFHRPMIAYFINYGEQILTLNSAIGSDNIKSFSLLESNGLNELYSIELQENCSFNSDDSYEISYSPDNKYFILKTKYDYKRDLSRYDSATYRIFNLENGELLFKRSIYNEYNNKVVFSEDSKLFLYKQAENVTIYENNGKIVSTLKLDPNSNIKVSLSSDNRFVITTDNYETIFYETKTGKLLYTRIHFKNNDWIIYDDDSHYDGTKNAFTYLYLTKGLKNFEDKNITDKLYVPGLAEKIIRGETLEKYPKLSDLIKN